MLGFLLLVAACSHPLPALFNAMILKKCSFCAAFYSSLFQLTRTSKVHFIATYVISELPAASLYTALVKFEMITLPLFFLTFNKTSEFTARGGTPLKGASSFFSFTEGRGN